MASVFDSDSIFNIHLLLCWCPLPCIHRYVIHSRTHQIAKRIEKI